jgi:hypothetical protein
MAEFIGNVFEHYCPENWIPDPDNPPHEKCSICEKRHILSAIRVREEKRKEARRERIDPDLIESYEVQVRSERLPGQDWDGQWVKWENKKKGTSSWQSLQRVRGSMKQMANAPNIYRIVRVLTRPAVIEKTEIVEIVENTGKDPDFVRQDFSKKNLDEMERPVYEVSSESIELD